MYSCYWSLNTPYAEFEDFLCKLETSIRASPEPVIVARDLNVKHSSWGSPVDGRKGKALADFVQELDLAVCNTESASTREQDGYQSNIDVTLVSARLQLRVMDWAVLHDETLSDHNYIQFTVGDVLAVPLGATGWSTRFLDNQKFLATLAEWEPAAPVTAEESARDLSAALTRAMEDSTLRRTPHTTRRKSVYWWSLELDRQRKLCNHLRRVCQRKKQRGEDYAEERNSANCVKLALTTSIRRAKDATWV